MKKTEQKPKAPIPSAQATPKKKTADSTDNLSLAEIKQLIELISEKQFNEFELERGDFRLRLQRGTAGTSPGPGLQVSPKSIAMSEGGPVHYAPAESPASDQSNVPSLAAEESLHIITSPIVGTFYRSSSPTSEPFAKLGDLIEAGRTLCIIEAMKLMNEIPSDAGGSIAKIFVENGQPVEYGQPLFGIRV